MYLMPRVFAHIALVVSVAFSGAGCWLLGAGCWVLSAECCVVGAGFSDLQAAQAPARKPPAAPVKKPALPPAAALKKEPAEVSCPAPLGVGVKTKTSFCNVIAGRDPAGGVLIKIPPHKGIATLTFDLHNLHLYSEEQVKAKKAFARYTATIGVMTMDNTIPADQRLPPP